MSATGSAQRPPRWTACGWSGLVGEEAASALDGDAARSGRARAGGAGAVRRPDSGDRRGGRAARRGPSRRRRGHSGGRAGDPGARLQPAGSARGGAAGAGVLAGGAAPHDESLLADLLRREAAVRGPSATLERFGATGVSCVTGSAADPGEALRRTQRGLLAEDRPVRHGVRYDATELIGRDGDLDRLRALLAGSRVVSIVGTGGLGKTRLAHVLAREATAPVVHFVELAGVTSAEDVAVEVGSVLGVRDSVSGRRTLTAEQRADIRTRIARLLGAGARPARARQLRAPDRGGGRTRGLPDRRDAGSARAHHQPRAARDRGRARLPARRARAGDAAELFRERAVAARPDVRLDERVVASIVGRLDGLPLAIELAAAKARVMSVEEIDRRLEDRFALLRGGDRSAPDRHQALLTVIEWSWNLLDAAEQRALRRLALFHDGFTLDAAEAVLGRTRSRRCTGWSTSRCSTCARPRPGCATACWRRCASSAGCSSRTPARTPRPGLPSAAGPPATRPRTRACSGRRAVRGGRRAGRRGDQPGRRAARRAGRRRPGRSCGCWPRSGCSGRCAASTSGCSCCPRRSATPSRLVAAAGTGGDPRRGGDHAEQHADGRPRRRRAA